MLPLIFFSGYVLLPVGGYGLYRLNFFSGHVLPPLKSLDHHVKHEVTDEYAVEKTHPVFYSVGEQWQGFTEYLQDLPSRHFVLKMRGQKAKVGKTRHLPKPKVDPQELREVEQEYLRRYFYSKQEIAGEARGVREIWQPAALYQPINRRERLR